MQARKSMSRWARGCLVVALAGALGTSSAPARAHPFGTPPHLSMAVDGATVRMSWQAASDDLTALAGALGLVDSSQTFVYDADGELESAPAAEDEQLAGVAGDPALAEYMSSHVTIETTAGPCTLDVDTARFPTAIDATATCPAAPEDLQVTVTMLHDLHPAYRTVGSLDGNDARAVFTTAQPTATLAVTTAASSATAWPWIGVVATLVIAGSGAGVLWRRRRTDS